MVGGILFGVSAGAAVAASPVGLWKRSTGNQYRWVSLGGGVLEEVSLTVHSTPTNHCRVASGSAVYRYHPLGRGLYREDEWSWDRSCKASWDLGAETVKLAVTATTLKLYCGTPYTETCATYTRLDSTAPRVRALASTGTVGGDTVLRYLVSDASGKTWEAVTLYADGTAIRRYRTTLGPAKAGRIYGYRLKQTPASFRGTFRFCVQSHDAAGNTSPPSCTTVTIR